LKGLVHILQQPQMVFPYLQATAEYLEIMNE
jgi:hypothetical protein